jgi:hypothetical protein
MDLLQVDNEYQIRCENMPMKLHMSDEEALPSDCGYLVDDTFSTTLKSKIGI